MAAVTSLAAQLQRLATPQTSILDQKRDRRSILFDPSEAAKYGRDVYYDIGLSGLETLVRTDSRFAAFSESLFGRASRDLQRAVEDREVNNRLDAEIEKFLLLLSPYLQKEAALKALEWLVYRYQVNEMNKRPLLMCIFPYYESPLFMRILQIVSLSGDQGEWQWLSQCQKNARPLPKLSVFTQWGKKRVFRNFLADYLKKMMKAHTRQETPTVASSFYITTVLGGLGVSEVREEHLASIVKSLHLCLASEHPHLVSGIYLILAHVACKTHLSPTLLNSVMLLLVQTPLPTDDLLQPCLLTLLTLAHHQEMGGVEEKTFAALGDNAALLGELGGLARDKSVAALVCPFLGGYIRHLMGEEGKKNEEKKKKKGVKMEEEERRKKNIAKKFNKLIQFLASLPLASSDAGKVVWSVLESLSCHPRLLSLPGVSVAQAVRDLELSHPQGHNEAIARLTVQQNDPNCGKKYRKVLNALVLPSMPFQPHCLTQLLHTDEGVRTAAVEAFLERLAKGVEAPGEVTSLHIRSMLSDDCPAIPCLALSTPKALQALSPALLADLCHKLLERKGKEWRKARELSIVALSGTVAESCDAQTRNMALSVCLPVTLMPRVASDLALSKNVLKSELAHHCGFLSALKKEIAACLSAEYKLKDYSARMWSAVPRIIASLSAADQEALLGLLECQGGGQGQVLALGLLYAGLGSGGVKGNIALALAHRMLDGCLALMEEGKVSSPPKEGHSWTDKQVTPNNLHTCISQVTQGDLPCDLLVTCVLRAAGVFVLPSACQDTPYWTPFMEEEPGQGHLLLLVKVTRAALRLERVGVTAARDAILCKVLKKCLPNSRKQLHFLALLWGWQAALPFSNLIDDTLQTWSLKLGMSLLSLGTALSWTLSPDSPLVPALLSALTSAEGLVRGAAVECLRGLAAIPGAALTAESVVVVVKLVVAQAEELVEDGSQLAALLSHTVGDQRRQQQQASHCLLGLLVGDAAPPHIKAALLYALSGATQPGILLNLIPFAEELLNQAEDIAKKKTSNQTKQEQEEEEEMCLDSSSSLCLLYILQRFTGGASKVLESESGWKVFKRALSCSRACLNVHGDFVSPQGVLLKEVLSTKFLSSLVSQVTQAQLWSLLVSRVTASDDPQEASRLRHALRRVTLDAEVIVGQIEALELVPKVTSIREAREKRIKMKEDSNHLQAWHKLRLMMETLTVMADLKRPWLLVNPLFNALQLTLTLDLTSTTLLQQQVLSTLLHLLHKSIEELGEQEVARVTQVSVEVVVQVVRASLSHDTQRRALQLLAVAARLVPESVLHNMMAIFTFMGTSLLRRDDAYSFQVIHQTIEAIVPTLIKFQGAGVEARLAQVCQVFVDALPDLPHHRRLPLFTQLANTLQPDDNLWLLLALLADSHVTRSGGSSGGEGEEEKSALPQAIQFSLILASHFPPTTQLCACIKLVYLVSSLPDDQDGAKILQQQQQQQQKHRKITSGEPKKKKKKKMMNEEEEEEMEVVEAEEEEVKEVEQVDVTLLPLSTHTQRQIFYLKYPTTALIGHLLVSERFVGKVFEVEEQGDGEKLQTLYKQLLRVTMCFLQAVTFACHLHQDKPSGRLFAALQRKVVEVVEGVTSLLPPPALLRVTQGLLTSAVPLVRAKAAELLAAKLLPSSQAFFRAEDTPALQTSLRTLSAASVSKEEAAENRQTYLFCLQLLTRYLATHTPQPSPNSLQPALTTAVGVLCDEEEEVRVVTQALLVVAEAVAALQVAAVGCLGRLMPALIRLMAAATAATTTTTTTTATTTTTTTATATAAATTTQLLAILTALHKVVDSLPQLLSPHLEELVCQVCLVKPPEEAGTGVKEGKVAGKLASVRESLVKKVEARVLVPKMTKAFHQLSKGESLWPVESLVTLVEALVGEVAAPRLPNQRPALLSLLTTALDLRHARGTAEGGGAGRGGGGSIFSTESSAAASPGAGQHCYLLLPRHLGRPKHTSTPPGLLQVLSTSGQHLQSVVPGGPPC
ncbi:HEAT repeat-containing protein 1-like [Scylla paramamosain]|uniref:HEAT repeat-containing protein 1-like n=1 Tax=Scylla paramamosain TaxID=85552 RepID=UPI0030837FBF